MTKGKAPISSHRAFPAIVALWFAALLGIGSLVLPVPLVERLVEITGLGSAWPAAQPPLGVTARLAIALTCAAVGVVAGLWLARKVAGVQTVESPRRRKAAPAAATKWEAEAKRPLSPREDLGFDSIDAADELDRPLGLGRRRALAVTEESGRSDFLEAAPLPGQDACAPAELDLGAFADEQAGEEPAEEPVARFSARRGDPEPEPITVPEPEPEPADSLQAAAEPIARAEAHEMGEKPRSPTRLNPAVAERPLNELGIVELVERFALSLQRRNAAAAAPVTLPQLKASRGAVTAAEIGGAPARAVAQEEGASSSPAELSETPAAEIASAPEEPLSVPPLPAALRPIAFDDLDEDDSLAPPAAFSIKLEAAARPFDRAEPAPFADDDDDESAEATGESEAAGDDGGYGSLLAMRGPLGAAREFVRIEDEDDEADEAIEPVVVFPGQPVRRAAPAADGPSRGLAEPAPFRPFDGPLTGQGAFSDAAVPSRPAAARPDPRETERSLREALEKLQRMSGAA